MRRIIFMAMVLAVTVAGCNRFPDNGLQVNANLLPDDSCFVAGDQEERLLRGLWDVGLADGGGNALSYMVALQLTSYLVSNALEFQGEQNNLQVDNYDITILLPDGTKAPLPEGVANPYRVTTSAVIPATEPEGTPAQDVGVAIGVPGSYQAAILGLNVPSIMLDIRAGGTTRGGFSQRSAPFLWPIDLCSGCLLDCESEDLADSCLPGQDVWPYCPVGMTPAP